MLGEITHKPRRQLFHPADAAAHKRGFAVADEGDPPPDAPQLSLPLCLWRQVLHHGQSHVAVQDIHIEASVALKFESGLREMAGSVWMRQDRAR